MELDTATRAILADPRKRRSWVIYRLQLNGRSLAALAQKHGVTRQCVYQVFRQPYPHMEKLVADAVGLEPQVLFAERYDERGRSLRARGRPRKNSCHGKNDKPKAPKMPCSPGL